ncbi:hypothetical protein CRG98_019580 [Punica granatum]|uniref:Uncharacterized protein n=1 Tax=Punica granatum TaxID=22663 RepID=A0A2I0JVX7_PUNGR|nr:hypothetical protein CRG98_019580 [Punica granatum]
MAVDFRRSGRRSCSRVNNTPVTSSSARRSASLRAHTCVLVSSRTRSAPVTVRSCSHARAPRTSLRVHACTSTLSHVRLPCTLVTSTRALPLAPEALCMLCVLVGHGRI